MSDSLVNTDAEDVLASIKRLVTEGGSDESEFIFIPTAAAPKPGRLVLTDALRVSDQPLRPGKPTPLMLTPEDSADSPGAANTADGPMRLEPSDSVPPEVIDDTPPVTEQVEPAKADRDLAGSLSAKIEALEAAIARTEDQWEPDGESNDAYSGTRTRSMRWSIHDGFDAPDTEKTGTATFIRHSDKADAQPSGDGDEQTFAEFPDEEALREFIAQVVRDELQGALGERITRNLRKMVRREIYRALVTQKLE